MGNSMKWMLEFGLFIAMMTSTYAADLRMRFVYDGDPPEPKPLVIDRDVQFCGQHKLFDESLLVNKENNGIANVVVYLFTGRRGTDLKAIQVPPAKPRRVVVDIKNCRYQSRVSIARVGDTLVWNTGDGVGHNSNFQFLNNPALGLFIPINVPATRKLTVSEPAPVPVECNIHPREQSHLVVLDHPFAAVSDENGLLEITGLPKGKPLFFRANHECLSFKEEVTVDGQVTAWRLNKFERSLTGETDQVIMVNVPPKAK